jgi:hypothetical protein
MPIAVLASTECAGNCIAFGGRDFYLLDEGTAYPEVLLWCEGTTRVGLFYVAEDVVEDIATSKQGFIAFRVRVVNESPDFTALADITRYNYVILNTTGSVERVILGEKSIVEASWSPDGGKLIYTQGDLIEAEPYASHGLYLFTLSDNESQRLTSSGRNPVWAEFDGNIYYWDYDEGYMRHVYCLNPTSGEISKTRHKGNMFSRKGNYYTTVPWDYDMPIQIYAREGGQESLSVPVEIRERLWPRMWITDSMLLCQDRFDTKRSKPDSYIIDVKTGKLYSCKGYCIGLLSGECVGVYNYSKKSVERRCLSDLREVDVNEFLKEKGR